MECYKPGYEEGNGETAVDVEKINDEETVGCRYIFQKIFKSLNKDKFTGNKYVLTRTSRAYCMRCQEKKWNETSRFICVKKCCGGCMERRRNKMLQVPEAEKLKLCCRLWYAIFMVF